MYAGFKFYLISKIKNIKKRQCFCKLHKKLIVKTTKPFVSVHFQQNKYDSKYLRTNIQLTIIVTA